jgi:hypothetical protein
LNDSDPFGGWPAGKFDVIILGEVIEHILNHPVGLLAALNGLSKPEGLLVLTTPNPSTLVNALRVVADRQSLWGTREFASEPKVAAGRVTTAADIHYREYRKDELLQVLRLAGWSVVEHRFMRLGCSDRDRGVRRLAKSLINKSSLASMRIFGTNHYVLARRSSAANEPGNK